MTKRNTSLFGAILILLVGLVGCGDELTFEELTAKGKKAFVEKDYKTARETLKSALMVEPSNREILYFIGMSYRKEFILDSALLYLKKLDLLYPDDRETHLQLHDIAVRLEDWENARTALAGLVRTGDNIELYYEKFSEYWAKDDNPLNGYFFIKKALEVNSEDPNLYIQAGNLASIVKEGSEAVVWMDSAITRFGTNDAFLSNKALFLARESKYDLAELIYRDLLSRDTSYIPGKLNLANSLASQDVQSKKREALVYYKSIKSQATLQMMAELPIDSIITALEVELK